MTPEHKKIIEAISAAAETLQQTVDQIPAGLLEQRPRPDEWSVVEILNHTRNVVMFAYGLRLRRLIFEDEPTFADYDEEKMPSSVREPQLPAADLLEMIVADHRQTARLLSALTDEEWDRQGHHPESGAMSIAFLARRIAAHADEHTEQIASTFAALSAGGD